jgi:beta-glucosidase
MITRRSLIAAAGMIGPLTAASARVAPRHAPPGFLWGTAISAHQSEGGDTNSDGWLLENITPTRFIERSGDACDSYHRYAEDIALNAALGFNCYRFGIEWARIEPSPGQFSNAALDHYVRVLEACRAHKQTPIVTFSHFTVPRWFAERGGFEIADGADIFARYCGKATERLGPLMGMASTFNEANIQLLFQLMAPAAIRGAAVREMIAAARKATGSEQFSSLVYADPARSQPILLDAHRKAYQAMKAARASLPVGVTLSTQEIQGVNESGAADAALTAAFEQKLYGDWVEAARDSADFIGVQTYTRLRFDRNGIVPPPEGAELTAAGYEYYPQALAATIRWAHKTIGKPVYVTESGIGTDDDARRIAFIDQALDGVHKCIAEGIPVHSYMYWSLLDNFEWSSGYKKHFGLVAVDLKTFKRTPKPSARYLGRRAKRNLL